MNITILWNQGVQTGREVLANRPDIIIIIIIIIIIKKGTNLHTDRCISAIR
jgi:hypothetical protein